MGAAEISSLIELSKKVAELEFKKNYLLHKGRTREDATVISIATELEHLSRQVNELESRITIREAIFYPNEKRLAEFKANLAKYGVAEIANAMERKEGELYTLLEKRGRLLKKNYERRKEIAALVEFVNSMPSKSREEISERIREGKIGILDASTLSENERMKLFRLLNRAGIPCFVEAHKLVSESKKGISWAETRVTLNGSGVWTEPDEEAEIAKFGEELANTGNLIQVTNAERQVRKFSADEEKQFRELQKKYLGLLRKRDALLSR